MIIRFYNPKTGVSTDAPQGFSWTTLIFGFFVPLLRGDWIFFIVMLASAFLTMGISNFIWCFIYNKIYTNNLYNNGFQVEASSNTVNNNNTVNTTQNKKLSPSVGFMEHKLVEKEQQKIVQEYLSKQKEEKEQQKDVQEYLNDNKSNTNRSYNKATDTFKTIIGIGALIMLIVIGYEYSQNADLHRNYYTNQY